MTRSVGARVVHHKARNWENINNEEILFAKNQGPGSREIYIPIRAIFETDRQTLGLIEGSPRFHWILGRLHAKITGLNQEIRMT